MCRGASAGAATSLNIYIYICKDSDIAMLLIMTGSYAPPHEAQQNPPKPKTHNRLPVISSFACQWIHKTLHNERNGHTVIIYIIVSYIIYFFCLYKWFGDACSALCFYWVRAYRALHIRFYGIVRECVTRVACSACINFARSTFRF